MKSFLTILSAAIFLFGGAGYYLAFSLADERVKNEVAQSIETLSPATYVELSFSQEELQRMVVFTGFNQKEFIYQGKHYDVVKVYKQNSTFIFTCVADEKETALFSHMDQKVNDQAPGNPYSKASPKTVMQDWFFQNTFSLASLAVPVILFNEEKIFPFNLACPVLSPPPKC